MKPSLRQPGDTSLDDVLACNCAKCNRCLTGTSGAQIRDEDTLACALYYIGPFVFGYVNGRPHCFDCYEVASAEFYRNLHESALIPDKYSEPFWRNDSADCDRGMQVNTEEMPVAYMPEPIIAESDGGYPGYRERTNDSWWRRWRRGADV